MERDKPQLTCFDQIGDILNKAQVKSIKNKRALYEETVASEGGDRGRERSEWEIGIR